MMTLLRKSSTAYSQMAAKTKIMQPTNQMSSAFRSEERGDL